MTFDLGAEVAKATADYLAERAIPGVDFEIPASIRKPAWIPNRAPCGAFLKHDLSGVRMRSHISDCEPCQRICAEKDAAWEREQGE